MTEKLKLLTRENNTAHQKAKRVRQGEGSAFEVYFAASPPPSEQPVIVFHHIQKTAGTSLRQIIHRNYVGAGAHHKVFGAPAGYDGAKMPEWTAKFLNSLSAKERESIICVAAHGANHLMHQLDRPTRALTFLRDPVDRIMSRYYFGAISPEFTLEEFYRAPHVYALGNKVRPNHFRQYCNPQSCSLLEPLTATGLPELGWTRGTPSDAQLWRERLFRLIADKYIVGLQDRFEESVIYFGRQMGWNDLFVPHAKFNATRPREVDEDLKAEILEYNWLDQELYRYFASRPIGAQLSGSP